MKMDDVSTLVKNQGISVFAMENILGCTVTQVRIWFCSFHVYHNMYMILSVPHSLSLTVDGPPLMGSAFSVSLMASAGGDGYIPLRSRELAKV